MVGDNRKISEMLHELEGRLITVESIRLCIQELCGPVDYHILTELIRELDRATGHI
jgi:hypothetical protein